MHAVRYGLVALGISVCLGSSSSPAQTSSQTGRRPTAAAANPAAANPAHRSGVARAVGTSAPSRDAVRQVAGQQPVSSHRRSDGLLGAWMQPGDEEGPSLLQRLGIGGSSRDEAPDWEGVPYHRPVRPTTGQTSVPITDPHGSPSRSTSTSRSASRNTSRSASTSRSAPRTTSARANVAIPTPPAEDAISRRSTPTSSRTSARTSPDSTTASTTPSATSSRRSSASTETAPPSTSTVKAPLSSTESSRRSERRPVDPLDVYLQSTEIAAAVPPTTDQDHPAATGSESDEPRVTRRPIPAAGNATSSRKSPSTSTPVAPSSPSTHSLPPSLAASNESSAGAAQSPSPNRAAATVDVPAAPRGDDAVMALSAPASDERKSPSIETGRAEKGFQGSDDSWQASTGTSTATATSTATGRSAARTGSGLAAAATESQPQLEVSAPSNPRSIADGSSSTSTGNAQPISVTSEIPGVRVVTSGPAEIPVRRPASYEIRVENRGSIPAPGALVRISLPRWINIQGQQTSRGDVNQGGDESARQLLWQIEGLAPEASETLTLQLSAVEARKFDVAVEWAVLPESNIATVQVHEPKLELLIEGPEKVVYGQSQAYKVRVLNPGNGVAEDVVFTLSPNSTPQSQRIGSIPPGKEAHFEVELTARDLENLQIHGLAVGNSALKTEAVKSIEVIAADLEAVLSGPPLRYQDSSATYKLELANLGEADCDQVTAMLRLPSGVRYEEGLQDAEVNGNVLQWRLDRLPAGGSFEYEFTCSMQRTGEQEIAFECAGSAAGATSVVFTTEVEAIADLVLAIDNPAAPAPVGEEVVYEIILRNRGSKAATDVETLAQFSHDIEPVRIDGGKGQLGSGQVLFDAIPRIDAGEEVRLRVIAKADKAGVHRFRTEIRSGGEALLVSEESTRYVELAGQRVSRRSSEKADVK